MNKGANAEDVITAAEISAAREVVSDKSLKEEPDISLTLSFDFYAMNNPMFQKPGLYGFKEGRPNSERKSVRVLLLSHHDLELSPNREIMSLSYTEIAIVYTPDQPHFDENASFSSTVRA